MSVASKARVTSPHDLKRKKQDGTPIAVVTAYDATTTKLVEQTESVDVILVGDSLGMVVLGYNDTVHVTMADMLHHTKAVSRGIQRCMLVADMPFMSVNIDPSSAKANVMQLLQDGGAHAVKIEGAAPTTLTLIRELSDIGISVMGHLGFTPQTVYALGGYKVQGKTDEAAQALIDQALALEAAGAFAIVLEMVPTELATLISQLVSVPTIGIGAGPHCDGQVLVIDDLLGRYGELSPRFVRRYADVGEATKAAIQQYAKDVVSRHFPNTESESFPMPEATWERIQARYADINKDARPYAHR